MKTCVYFWGVALSYTYPKALLFAHPTALFPSDPQCTNSVPDEMAYLGFVSFRWLFLSTFAISSWLLIQAQLRNVGYPRHYASPSDIVSCLLHSAMLHGPALQNYDWATHTAESNTTPYPLMHTLIRPYHTIPSTTGVRSFQLKGIDSSSRYYLDGATVYYHHCAGLCAPQHH